MKLTPSPSVAWQMVGPEAVLVDLRSGLTLGLNESGSFIWKRLTTHSGEQIASELAAEYRIPIDDAERDVREFLQTLVDRGFAAVA